MTSRTLTMKNYNKIRTTLKKITTTTTTTTTMISNIVMSIDWIRLLPTIYTRRHRHTHTNPFSNVSIMICLVSIYHNSHSIEKHNIYCDYLYIRLHRLGRSSTCHQQQLLVCVLGWLLCVCEISRL